MHTMLHVRSPLSSADPFVLNDILPNNVVQPMISQVIVIHLPDAVENLIALNCLAVVSSCNRTTGFGLPRTLCVNPWKSGLYK